MELNDYEIKHNAILREMGAECTVLLKKDGRFPLTNAGKIALYGSGARRTIKGGTGSGEGADRSAVAGEIKLSETEIRDILACDEKYPNFMLVLNVGGVVDLTPVLNVKNILILSQLGIETGNILADILLGTSTPSGKLTTTWSAWEDYPQIGTFGDKNETRYKEGLYVGYRYFDSVGKKPLFAFGYGLSYTEFAVEETVAKINGSVVTVDATVKNTGEFTGKEVLQVYVSVPNGKLDQPYQTLAGFAKTRLLTAGASEQVSVSFDMKDIASYDSDIAAWILGAGDYILRIGTSSVNTVVAGAVRIEKDVAVKKVKNAFGKPDFVDFKPEKAGKSDVADVAILMLAADAIVTQTQEYHYSEEIDSDVEGLSDDQLVKLNMGAFNPKSGVASMIGNAGFTVAGAAGQSSMEAAQYGIPSLIAADGPAGLRLSRDFVKNAKGVHSLGYPFPESIMDFLPKIATMFIKGYKPKKNEVVEHQYCTALPIGTAIAQSFNVAFAEMCGDIVGDEMERFGVHLWLAPALNLHRDIRCGRNFEYYSEDPLISGEFAAAITRGVQKHPGCGTTIKHFAANNQELNRTQNNSQISERVFRELYLRGFEIAIKRSQPKAIMTSYNLVNGVHTAENRELLEDVLRNEFGFEGIVMTDWTIADYANDRDSVHPITTMPGTVMAGSDLFMPGGKKDYDATLAALQSGKVTKRQLQINATRVTRMAKELVGGGEK